MTDAAAPVTERAVEQFVEAYLTAVGADLYKEGRRWTVSIPETADTNLDLNEVVLQIASDPDEVDNEAVAVTPGSPLVERLLNEAAERFPVGSVALTGEDWGIRLPPWITAGPADVVDQTFTPYYDRRALCALFHIGIETVSEYQWEELHAIAIDLSDHEGRPELAESYLDLTEADRQQSSPDITPVNRTRLSEAIDTARTTVESEIEPIVQEIQERATRAAEVELDEYRQFVYQRHAELEEEISRLDARIEEVNETAGSVSVQGERVGALRKRKQLRSELDETRSELDGLANQIETGFPEKRSEIRERHSLTVRIRPVTATAISYERGDLELALRAGDDSTEVTYAYAVGSGVIRNPTCERCEQEVTENNPLTVSGKQLIGAACCAD
jgi:uncharacterized coiled-coil DUF342 family protein